MKTDWYEPNQKPVRVGYYEAEVFDGGWIYEWRMWFDGETWRDCPNGWALANQNVKWRGQDAEC
ncbi:hypothetical protein [Paraburkholderia acidisoli]|uniref:Uncharacterized protein n=1 Tax=Paraburkholderia acidisoli TaxID=2571748 RepID=A0A7Z2JKH4_9BURK|nr:hypothetical protein [Paraburkholderia acidisoli]QGZ66294.1 hypothetical protein FAZ98_31360 [Paraburkholderia acidisoli]QGZ66380.1 hypothetical protein FAZ98_31845 [Paraburkholderia acidisoli]